VIAGCVWLRRMSFIDSAIDFAPSATRSHTCTPVFGGASAFRAVRSLFLQNVYVTNADTLYSMDDDNTTVLYHPRVLHGVHHKTLRSQDHDESMIRSLALFGINVTGVYKPVHALHVMRACGGAGTLFSSSPG